LRFFSMANDEYLLAVAKDSRLATLDEIGIDDPGPLLWSGCLV
jgi:hypothetical protein